MTSQGRLGNSNIFLNIIAVAFACTFWKSSRVAGSSLEPIQPTNKTMMPWHVGLYRNIEGKYRYSCGGTIINTKLIISVAHCLWDEANQSIRDTSSFTIGAGILHKEFYGNESAQTQLRNISEIVIHPNYMGPVGNYKADIAVIVLSNPLIISRLVAPVCIQRESGAEHDFGNNLHGTVPFWGTGESKAQEFKTISVRGSTYDVCQTELEAQSSSFLASDKFCVLNKFNDEMPCLDSGAGFVVEKIIDGKSRHCLMGAVSTVYPAPRYNNCSNVIFIGLTNIQYYENFIRNLESRYMQK